MKIDKVFSGANFGGSLIVKTRNKAVLNKVSYINFYNIAGFVDVKGVPSNVPTKGVYRRIILDGLEGKSLNALEKLNNASGSKYDAEYAKLLEKIIKNTREIEVNDINLLRGLYNCKSVKGILASIKRFAEKLPKQAK